MEALRGGLRPSACARDRPGGDPGQPPRSAPSPGRCAGPLPREDRRRTWLPRRSVQERAGGCRRRPTPRPGGSCLAAVRDPDNAACAPPIRLAGTAPPRPRRRAPRRSGSWPRRSLGSERARRSAARARAGRRRDGLDPLRPVRARRGPQSIWPEPERSRARRRRPGRTPPLITALAKVSHRYWLRSSRLSGSAPPLGSGISDMARDRGLFESPCGLFGHDRGLFGSRGAPNSTRSRPPDRAVGREGLLLIG
jgi:hypothetical protein